MMPSIFNRLPFALRQAKSKRHTAVKVETVFGNRTLGYLGSVRSQRANSVSSALAVGMTIVNQFPMPALNVQVPAVHVTVARPIAVGRHASTPVCGQSWFRGLAGSSQRIAWLACTAFESSLQRIRALAVQ